MNCGFVDGVLDRLGEGAEVTPEVQRHLEECAQCRVLHGWIATPSRPELSSESATRITRSLTASLQPTEPLAAHRVIVRRLLLVFAVVAVTLIGIRGPAGFERMRLAQILSVGVVLTAGAFLFSVSLSWQIRPGSYQRLPAAGILAAFGIGVLAGISLFFPWNPVGPFFAEGVPCLVAGLAMATAAGVLLWLVVRRGAPLSTPKLGATLGATAGILGFTVQQVHCPLQEASHLLLFHGGAVALSALGGWGIGYAARLLAARR